MDGRHDRHSDDDPALSSGEAERLLRRVHAALSEVEAQRRDFGEVVRYAHRLLIIVSVVAAVSIVTDVVDLLIPLLDTR